MTWSPRRCSSTLDATEREIAGLGQAIRPAIEESASCFPTAARSTVHRRSSPGATKDLDDSFDIVRVHNGEVVELVEGMAARAYAVSQLTGMPVLPLACPHCSEVTTSTS